MLKGGEDTPEQRGAPFFYGSSALALHIAPKGEHSAVGQQNHRMLTPARHLYRPEGGVCTSWLAPVRVLPGTCTGTRGTVCFVSSSYSKWCIRAFTGRGAEM